MVVRTPVRTDAPRGIPGSDSGSGLLCALLNGVKFGVSLFIDFDDVVCHLDDFVVHRS